ncbi:MAG: PTS mannose transporter subunit IIA [Pigmentiphaga sp.]|nr:PTS mannose transporter subunit IIA [Pigmentiphaga sp.]
MKGIVIVGHEPVASALLACAEHIFGPLENVLALDVEADTEPVRIQQALAERTREADSGEGVLVLIDVIGATPSNQSCQAVLALRETGRQIAVVGGVNVPMLLRAIPNRHLDLEELARHVLAGGTQGMRLIDLS